MTNIEKLKNAYPDKLITVKSLSDIPKGTRLVYILFYGDLALVVGEGEENRARVITDDINSITPSHKKAIKVRLYCLFGDPKQLFSRYIIKCDSKIDAQSIEKNIHKMIGGNDSSIDPVILQALFKDWQPYSHEWIFMKLALCSAFDGISDLKCWRREAIINDEIWTRLCKRIQLNYKMPNNALQAIGAKARLQPER